MTPNITLLTHWPPVSLGEKVASFAVASPLVHLLAFTPPEILCEWLPLQRVFSSYLAFRSLALARSIPTLPLGLPKSEIGAESGKA